MPFLQSSGAISLNDLKNFWGIAVSLSPSMSMFYRNIGNISTQKTVSTPYTIYEPGPGTSDWNYQVGTTYTYCWGQPTNITYYYSVAELYNEQIYWNFYLYGYYSYIGLITNLSYNTTSYTIGGTTYYKGNYVQQNGLWVPGGYAYGGYYTRNTYQVRRESTGYQNQTVSINTGIPNAGSPISLNQFYGAEKP